MPQLHNANILRTGKKAKSHLYLKRTMNSAKQTIDQHLFNNIFEKLLASQLQAHFNGILSDYLSAYRRNYSCQTALLRMVEDWMDSLDNNRLVATISIDWSKAFDSLLHALLLTKLKPYGLNHHTCHLLKDHLQDREQRVKISDAYPSWIRVK